MPKPLDTTISPESPDSETKPEEQTSQLNSPNLDEKTGKPTLEAISSFKQAHSIAKRQFEKAKARTETAAVIADKYGGSSPFNAAYLDSTGQGWRNNFSTNPLGSVVDRSTPQLTDPIKQAEYLTYSALPAERENAAEKTRKFRLRTTKLVRSWSGFPTLMSSIAQENYLYGNAAPGWIDDDWRPRFFRYDETFLPEGTGQHSKESQFVCYLQPMLLHDFLKKIEDKETAMDAGYDWEGCIKSANGACGLRDKGDKSPLEAVDSLRENGTLGFTYESDTKIVWMYHVLVREYDGGINLWTVEKNEGYPIRKQKDIHPDMEDASTFFTLQEGNMKYYGSKGAGRLLTNLHIAIDRGRNLSQDQIYLAGLPILIAKNGNINRVLPTVRHPFIVIEEDCEIAKERVEFDFEGFQYMDSQLTGIMNELAGAFIPPHTQADQSGATTKIEAAQKAERELAVKNGVLGRWFGQFANMMGAMQRKIYKPEHLKEGLRLWEENKEKEKKGIRVMAVKIWKWIKDVIPGMDKKTAPYAESKECDSEAVQCVVDLLGDGLSIEEIAELALSPAGNNVEEQPEEQDAKTIAFVQTKIGNPFYNQKAMAELEATTAIGEDRAKRILLPEQEDPNVEAVATRQQVTEWLNMMDGEAMPVSSTDLHPIHRKILVERMTPVMQSLMTAPTAEMSALGKLALQHYADHSTLDMNMTEQQKAQEAQGIADWQKAIEDADKQLAQLAEQAAAAGVPPGSVPPNVQGAPIQAQGPNGGLGEDGEDLDTKKARADAMFKQQDQDLRSRELDIREKELESKENLETMKFSTGVIQDAAAKEAEAIKAGIADAERERTAQAQASNPGEQKI